MRFLKLPAGGATWPSHRGGGRFACAGERNRRTFTLSRRAPFRRNQNRRSPPRRSEFAMRFTVLPLSLCLLRPRSWRGAPKGFRPLSTARTSRAGTAGRSTPRAPRQRQQLSPAEREKEDRGVDGGCEEALESRERRTGERRQGAYLATDRDYGDLELLLEYKTVAKADSGIYLRDNPQVQIWDWNQKFDAKNPTANRIWAREGSSTTPRDRPVETPCCSPTSRLVSGTRSASSRSESGPRFTSTANSSSTSPAWKTTGASRPGRTRFHRCPKRENIAPDPRRRIRWRNIHVREIPAAEANEMLRKHGSSGFESAFNGKDFTGWIGARELRGGGRLDRLQEGKGVTS